MTQSPPPQPPEETARELLAVTQADRDAAADFAGNYVPFTKEGMAALRSGTHDSHLFVQVFARHRLAALTHPISREAVAITDDVVRYIHRYGGRCRDCADENGICPKSSLPFADDGKAVRFVLEALNYGLSHGYLATPPSPSCLGVVEALEEIASGAARGLDDFKARMGGRKAPTWYAVNVLQDNLAACQGTARTALQSHRGEGR